MSIYSSILRNAVLPYLLRRDKRGSALKHWRFLEKSQYWARTKLQEYQWEKLSALLRHAYETSPYYSKMLNERGLTAESIKNFDDFSRLPILTRDELFNSGQDILSRKFDVSTLQKVLTGGTTGQQAPIYRDQEGFNLKLGMSWRHDNFMGHKLCDRLANIWPAHMDFTHNDSLKTKFRDRYLLRDVVYHAGVSQPEIMERHYRDILVFKPRFLRVFPAALYGFTEYLTERKYPFPGLSGIMSTGEPLYDYQRKAFEEYYQCPVFDMYGSRELGNTACECPAHEGLHIAMETSYVEFVRDGRPVEYGKEGEILITDLTNYAFPMIRYQINDYGRFINKPCSCGRGLELMSPGIGRLTDDLWDINGVRHNGVMLAVHITSELGFEIGQMQVIQKSLTEVVVKMIRNPELTREKLEFVTNRMKTMLGESVNIKIEPVDCIPKEKSGKMRFTICEIKPPGRAGQASRSSQIN